MDIEHFGFLSSVIRKRESHEQDGERLRGRISMRGITASGDPAMAFSFFHSVGTDGHSARLIRRPSF
jgi:hypothetical protein